MGGDVKSGDVKGKAKSWESVVPMPGELESPLTTGRMVSTTTSTGTPIGQALKRADTFLNMLGDSVMVTCNCVTFRM